MCRDNVGVDFRRRFFYGDCREKKASSVVPFFLLFDKEALFFRCLQAAVRRQCIVHPPKRIPPPSRDPSPKSRRTFLPFRGSRVFGSGLRYDAQSIRNLCPAPVQFATLRHPPPPVPRWP